MIKLSLLVLLLHGVVYAAGTPTGPPAAYTGDSWPTPTQMLNVDRCGRGTTGVCGNTTCRNNGAGSITDPYCDLRGLWLGTTPLTAGTLIKIRPGNPAATDKGVYGEVDTHLGAIGSFNADATLLPTVKGTSVCSGGTNANWDCRAGFESTDCPGGTCVYHPIVLQGTTEADGSQTTIDPTFVGGDLATGGTKCNGGSPGRYLALNFGNPACYNVSNERLICYGGSTWGKPCTTTGDCSGASACSARPWNWIIDHIIFQNWSDYDTDPTHSSTTNYCSLQVLGIGANHGCANGDVGQFVTIQNSKFLNNFGAMALGTQNAGAQRWFHNYVIGNYTHGYTSSINMYVPKDQQISATSYVWGNYVQDAGDNSPPWCNPAICVGTASTVQTCSGGPFNGASCTSEANCQGGHCGPPCILNTQFGATGTGLQNQGYNCYCKTTSDCIAGLACQANANYNGGCSPPNTEGKAFTIDTGIQSGVSGSQTDVRNNIFVGSWGDGACINSTGNFIFANNTLYHNARKGAGAAPFMEETMTPVRNADIWNNLVIPDPANCSCYGGTGGGTSCSNPGSTACPGGGVCYCPGLAQFDNSLTAGFQSTVHTGNELYWFNMTGQTTNPNIFLYGSNLLPGTLSAYQAYGTGNGWIRGQNTIAVDPQLISTTVGDPATTKFLHVATASPAGLAANPAFAPPWDFNNVTRPAKPGIGALEPDTGGATTSSSTTTTTSSTTTTTGPCGTNQTLWASSVSPPASNDNQAVTTGTRWFADFSGYVLGIRYYQQPGNTGTHVGHLWQETGQTTGTLLGTVTFVGETGSGWQQQLFPTAIAVNASPTIYMVDVYNPNGDYSGQTGVFNSQLDSGQLHGVASAAGTVTGNGRYVYSNVAGTYATNTFNAGGYFVDVLWVQCLGSTTTTTTTTTSTTTTTAPSGGFAPVNWGNDASVVAWWPYDVDTNNHSTSTTYCTTQSDANLGLFHGGDGIYGTINIDASNKKVGTASFSFDGNTTLAGPNTGSSDCLRTQQPNTWTFSWWGRVTAQNGSGSCTPFPFFLFNRSETSGDLRGVYIEYVSNGASNNGQTFASMRPVAGGTECIAYANNNGGNQFFTNDSTWRFGAIQYDGTNLKYSINGSSTPGSTACAFGKNPGDYPFQISHNSSIHCFAGVIGNQDDVFWTSAVLTTQQICRLMACGADGSKCWCTTSAGSTVYKTCATDADCGGRTGACNTTLGYCVGNLIPVSAGGLTGCSTLTDLPNCGAILTGSTTTTTTTTTGASTTTTTTTTSTTTTTLGVGQYRQQGSKRSGHKVQ